MPQAVVARRLRRFKLDQYGPQFGVAQRFRCACQDPLLDAVDVELYVIRHRKPKEPAEAVHRKPDHTLTGDHRDLVSEAIFGALEGVEHAAGIRPGEVQTAQFGPIADRDAASQDPFAELVGLDVAAERPIAGGGRLEREYLDTRPQAR